MILKTFPAMEPEGLQDQAMPALFGAGAGALGGVSAAFLRGPGGLGGRRGSLSHGVLASLSDGVLASRRGRWCGALLAVRGRPRGGGVTRPDPARHLRFAPIAGLGWAVCAAPEVATALGESGSPGSGGQREVLRSANPV
jgi:hypothetical protein